MTPIPAKPRQPRGKSHPSLQCHNLQDWVADGAVWSYPVSAKGGPAFGGNPQTEKPVEIQEGSSFSSFSTRTRGSSSFAIRLFSALSGFNHECQFRSIRFPYSELTAFVTCWSPHALSTGGRSSRNRICFNQIFYTAISTSWTLERGPCRKPSGGGSDRYSLSQKALRLISECSSTGTSFRLSQSGGSSGASDSWLETIRKSAKQALSVQFGAIFGLIGTFLRLIVQTMRRRLTPRSRLRRRRMAEFELAKPRIHPAEFYGGNEDDSADGPVQGAIRVWKP